jgi:hypothetical protein
MTHSSGSGGLSGSFGACTCSSLSSITGIFFLSDQCDISIWYAFRTNERTNEFLNLDQVCIFGTMVLHILPPQVWRWCVWHWTTRATNTTNNFTKTRSDEKKKNHPPPPLDHKNETVQFHLLLVQFDSFASIIVPDDKTKIHCHTSL